MNIKELGDDLEQQFGKPRNITEENVRFMLSLVEEEYDGEKVNEDVEKPSLDAFGMTILAVMSYQTTPWEELAKKPSIRKTLKYIAIRGGNHYDEIEALTKELMRKHFKGINQNMILGFLKIIRGNFLMRLGMPSFGVFLIRMEAKKSWKTCPRTSFTMR